MSVENAIYYLLANDATVAGLVATRIYPIALDQGVALPAIVYTEITGIPDYSCDGPTGQEASRYQITSWAETIPEAREIAEAVKDLFSGYVGTAASVTIQIAHVLNKYDVPAIDRESDETTQYGKAVDVMIHTAA